MAKPRVVLLRVGLDTGFSEVGDLSPLFDDGTFTYIPIPEKGPGEPAYGNTKDGRGRLLADYFSGENKRKEAYCRQIHFDPEFETYTYGDPTSNKAGLRQLSRGDYLVFYAGFKKYPGHERAGLYIFGYFVVAQTTAALGKSREELLKDFGRNAEVFG